MKYVRTKCDVEIIVREYEKHLFVRSKDENYYPNHRLDRTSVLKQADTIEELCDCFIGKVGDEEYIHLIGLWERKNYPAIKEVFGAIWTNKGLIYVAKIKGILPNGEIEWELL